MRTIINRSIEDERQWESFPYYACYDDNNNITVTTTNCP
jgi:hypothetical protein